MRLHRVMREIGRAGPSRSSSHTQLNLFAGDGDMGALLAMGTDHSSRIC